jgi:uncharacterized membrane protein (UPF0127 family)
MKLNKTTVIKAILISCVVLVAIVIKQYSASDSNKLETTELVIEKKDGSKVGFAVEIAKTGEEQEQGLMFRDSMPENNGMLFIFDNPRPVEFWMKNTYIPLDIIFIGRDNKIRKIEKNTSPNSLKTISSDTSVIAVLEINAMLSDKLNINKNDVVLLPN